MVVVNPPQLATTMQYATTTKHWYARKRVAVIIAYAPNGLTTAVRVPTDQLALATVSIRAQNCPSVSVCVLGFKPKSESGCTRTTNGSPWESQVRLVPFLLDEKGPNISGEWQAVERTPNITRRFQVRCT